MSQQLDYVTVKTTQPELIKKTEITSSTAGRSSQELVYEILAVFGVASLSTLAKNMEPITVDGDKIHIKEHLMIDDKPYAVRYKNKDYLFLKNGKTTKVFELRY